MFCNKALANENIDEQIQEDMNFFEVSCFSSNAPYIKHPIPNLKLPLEREEIIRILLYSKYIFN